MEFNNQIYPKISVIIPVYNVEKYLRECLDSVVNQTLRELEIICVDDGSTDSSLSILREYEQKDGRVKVLTQNNLHAGVARNNGLKVATGEYIHFLDSDDWLPYEAYENLYNLACQKEAKVLKFRCYSFDDKKKEVVSWYYTDIKNLPDEVFDNYLTLAEAPEQYLSLPDSPWSGIYERKFLQENNIHFDNLLCANDTSFFYRCALAAGKIYLSSGRYLYYRRNIESSLIGIRPRNFSCQIKQFYIIEEFIKSQPQRVQELVRSNLLTSLYSRYENYMKQKQLPISVKFDIWKLVRKFSKDNSDLSVPQPYNVIHKSFLVCRVVVQKISSNLFLAWFGLKMRIKVK